MKKLKVVSLFLILVVASVAAYLTTVLIISKPVMEGEIVIPLLEDKVEILRDKEGIPHIYAKKRKDMYFALGFVQASDRLFQYDMIRRAGAGETAEVIGPKTVEVDKLFRVLGGRRTFEKRLATLPQNIIDDFKSYTDGLNYYLENYPLPIEYKILRTRPAKFSIMDAYFVYTYLAYSFSPMFKEDQLHTRIVKTVENRDLSMLTSMGNTIEKKEVSLFDGISLDRLVGVDKILSNLSPIEGSNAWVISGQRSESGAPILSSDPHITFSLPNIWYEAHISNEEDDYEMYGHFLPLIPYPAMGHNYDFGWGLTMSYADDMDLYQEKIEGETYEFHGKKKELKVHREVIKVRGKKDIIIDIPITVRGPVADAILEKKGLSINWAFYLDNNRPLMTFHKINYAKTMQQVKEAISLSQSPGMNILYADSKGNIAHFIFGAYLKRSHPELSNVINSGDHEILGIYDYDLKPHRINPESGMLISTNDKPEDVQVDLRGLWYPKNRHDTVEAILKNKKKWTPVTMQKVQTSNLDIYALKYKKIIFDSVKKSSSQLSPLEVKAMNSLGMWNGKSDSNNIAATIYNHFNYKFLPEVLDELDKKDALQYCHSTASWYFHQRVFNDLKNKWWDDIRTEKVESADETILKIFKLTVADLSKTLGPDISKWNWGRIHTLEYPHPFGMSKLLGKFFNLGPYPVDGAINVINHNRRKGCENGHAVKSGPSTRRIVDFANPAKSFGILPLGNSGHQLSPFFDNQRERFLKGEYREQLLNILDVKRNLYSRLELLSD